MPDLIHLHASLTLRAQALMERKNKDYRGGSEDPFANFRGARVFGISPARGLLLRLQDKLMRFAAFDSNGSLAVSDESLEDTAIDVINYAVLLVALLQETRAAVVQPAATPPLAAPAQTTPPPAEGQLAGECDAWVRARLLDNRPLDEPDADRICQALNDHYGPALAAIPPKHIATWLGGVDQVWAVALRTLALAQRAKLETKP